MLTALSIVGFCVVLVLAFEPALRERLALGLLALVFSYRDIYKPDGRLYLRRYFITPRRWIGPGRWPRALSFVPERFRKIFLHRIRLSDDRTPHDHPWPFTSIILGGCYVEHTTLNPASVPVVRRKRARFGSVLRNAAEHVHRLEIVRPVWSLVFAGKAYREWGFWTRQSDLVKDAGRLKWVDWRTFLGCPNEPTPPEDAFEGDPWFEVTESFFGGSEECSRRFADLSTTNAPSARGISAAFEVGPVCGHSDHVNCRAPEEA